MRDRSEKDRRSRNPINLRRSYFRYLSDHGYNVATDSGNIADTQRIVKRLLDVGIFLSKPLGIRIRIIRGICKTKNFG